MVHGRRNDEQIVRVQRIQMICYDIVDVALQNQINFVSVVTMSRAKVPLVFLCSYMREY